MPPFRNPFVRRAPAVPSGGGASGGGTASLGVGDENARQIAANGIDKESSSTRPDYSGASRASSALSIKSRQEEPREYKLSGKSQCFFPFFRILLNFPPPFFLSFFGLQFVHILKKCLHIPTQWSMIAAFIYQYQFPYCLASSYIREAFLREELSIAIYSPHQRRRRVSGRGRLRLRHQATVRC